jgi:hypothetical protein
VSCQHAVELPCQALAAAAHPAFESGNLALEPIDRLARPEARRELRVAADRMVGEHGFELRDPIVVACRAVVAQFGSAKPLGSLPPKRGVARRERLRQADRRRAPRRRVELIGPEAHDLTIRAQGNDPRIAAATVLVTQHDHAAPVTPNGDHVTRA